MLHEFLTANRGAILALTRNKTEALSESKPTSRKLERGLPEFYDRLIHALKKNTDGQGRAKPERYAPSTTIHGEESLRLGYTVSQVVHGYGALCQAITETARKMTMTIAPEEFSTLNQSLDVAIAEAVTGFERPSGKAVERDSTKKIGFLVHELRNALGAAVLAHAMIKEGKLGVGGGTNAALDRNFERMRDLLDRSFFEIRLRHDPAADRHPMRLIEAVEEVEVTASQEARLKGLALSVRVDHQIQVDVDRNYLVSAVSNLVQNAIKFTKPGGSVWVRSVESEKSVALEVEDRCGGLPKGKAEELFQPFTQKSGDRTGLGLGLSISRRAVALNEGALSVRDKPGIGCVFVLTLPKSRQPALIV